MNLHLKEKTNLTWPFFLLLAVCVDAADPAAGQERANSEGAPASPVDPAAAHAALQEVPFDRVHIDDAFWTRRIETVQKVTIPDLLAIAEEQGKIDNVRIVAGRKKDGQIRIYNSPDSDVWKIMEAASYTLAWRRDPKLEKQLDELIALYAAAQAPDGYINTMYMLPADHPQSPPIGKSGGRYGYGPGQQFKGSIEQWPRGMGQFYCSGHLFEAAAAHYRATGKRISWRLPSRWPTASTGSFRPASPLTTPTIPRWASDWSICTK